MYRVSVRRVESVVSARDVTVQFFKTEREPWNVHKMHVGSYKTPNWEILSLPCCQYLPVMYHVFHIPHTGIQLSEMLDRLYHF